MLCGHYFPLHPHPHLLGFNAALFKIMIFRQTCKFQILFMETLIAVLYVQIVWFSSF